MAKTAMIVLEPDFYKDFRCTAANCRSNCCSISWNIYVDKATYKRMRKLKKPTWLSESFPETLRRNNNADDAKYALLQMKDNRCVCQTDEGLCRIHADLGEGYLCSTCRVYPRQKNIVPKQRLLEHGLTVSCEAVVEMLLHRNEPISFLAYDIEAPMSFTDPFFKDHGRAWNPEKQPVGVAAAFLPAQSLCIDLLQNRSYSFKQRMMLLAIFLDKLDVASESSKEELEALCTQFAQAVAEKLYDKVLMMEFSLPKSVFFSSIMSSALLARMRQDPIFVSCNRGLGNSSPQQRRQLYEDFMADKQELLEHLFVMELFAKTLPLHHYYSVRQCLYYITTVFAVFRFLLSAYLADKGTLTDQQLVDFIAFWGKSVLHNSGSFTTNAELLEKNDMTSLANLLGLIKG